MTLDRAEIERRCVAMPERQCDNEEFHRNDERRKPRIRVWTSGLEMDATVKATMRRKCVGSGFAFGECARDMDFEYDTEAERDAEFERVRAVFSNAIRMERR